MDTASTRGLRRAALLGTLAFGLALRLLGISFGLPYHHHWDEPWIADSVAGMLQRHDDVPASYQYGEPLMRLAELVFGAIRWANHRGGDITPVDTQTTIYLSARVATALVSSTGTLAVYLAIRRSRGGTGTSALSALAGSLLYAVAWEFVLQSRYAVTDACLVAMTAWTLAFTAIYLTRRTIGWGVLATLGAGLTCAFKIPGIVTSSLPLLASLLLFLRAHRVGQRRRAYGILLLATIPIVAMIYTILNPHILDHTSDALRDLTVRYRQTRDGGFSSCYLRDPGLSHLMSAVGAIVTQFTSSNRVIATAISAVSAWGIACSLWRRDRFTAISSAYAVVLVLSVAIPNHAFLFRNYLVVIPVMCVGFGSGVAHLTSMLRLRLRGTSRLLALSGVGAVAAAALVALPVSDAMGAQRLHQDPRVLALNLVAAQTRGDARARVAITPNVFGAKDVLAGYEELQKLAEPAGLNLLAKEVDACPSPANGPTYVIDATYRNMHRAPWTDPWQELWLFKECPGYHQVAAFDSSPFEADLQAYPTWPGRVSAIVLRRNDE